MIRYLGTLSPQAERLRASAGPGTRRERVLGGNPAAFLEDGVEMRALLIRRVRILGRGIALGWILLALLAVVALAAWASSFLSAINLTTAGADLVVFANPGSCAITTDAAPLGVTCSTALIGSGQTAQWGVTIGNGSPGDRLTVTFGFERQASGNAMNQYAQPLLPDATAVGKLTVASQAGCGAVVLAGAGSGPIVSYSAAFDVDPATQPSTAYGPFGFTLPWGGGVPTCP